MQTPRCVLFTQVVNNKSCAAQVLLYKRQANQGSFKPQLAMLQSVLDEAKQQQQKQLAHLNPLPQTPPLVPTATDLTAAEAIAAAAIDAAASRALAHGLGSSHGMRGIRKKGAGEGCKWETRSGLVYSKPKQYSSWHATSLEAAVAFDLVKLAVQGEGAAVNLPASVYTAEDVAAMAALVQHKRQLHSEQQQKQGFGVVTALGQQQPQEEQRAEEQQQQQLLLKCLTVNAGRHLLTLRPETGLARLQALAAVTGSSSSELLSRGLKGGNYLGQVLGLSVKRLQDSALAFQQQLGLQEGDLQHLLRAEPSLLHLRSDSLHEKVALLLPAFQQLCDALQYQTAAAVEGSVAAAEPARMTHGRLLARHRQQQRRCHEHVQGTAPDDHQQQQQQQQQHLQQRQPQQLNAGSLPDSHQQQQLLQGTILRSSCDDGLAALQQQRRSQQQLQDNAPGSSVGAGLAALQRAVLCQPQGLVLTADKVVRRLQVLQQCCCHPVLAAQVRKVLQTGSIGRWLAAGEVTVVMLQCNSVPCSRAVACHVTSGRWLAAGEVIVVCCSATVCPAAG
jgi:hypothetical protein